MRRETLVERLGTFARFPLMRGMTPLHSLENLSRNYGIDLRIKRDDLSGLAVGGNKTRKLEFLLGDALKQGADMVMTAGWYHSNHALQTAAGAARAQLPCLLFLKEGDPRKGSLFLDRLCGAEVRVFQVDGSEALGPEMERAAEGFRKEGRHPYVIPVGGSDAIGALGYVAAALELYDQCQAMGWLPDLVVCPTSSGGTHAGLLYGLSLLMPETRVLGFGVGDDPQKLRAKELDLLGGLLLRIGLGDMDALFERIDLCSDSGFGAYGRLASPVLKLIGEVGASEGLFLDPIYTGKAFWGLVDCLKRGGIAKGSRVLFVHSGGLSGLFQYEDEIYRDWELKQ